MKIGGVVLHEVIKKRFGGRFYFLFFVLLVPFKDFFEFRSNFDPV